MVELREGSALLHLTGAGRTGRSRRAERKPRPDAPVAAGRPETSDSDVGSGTRPVAHTITCGFCGQEFVEDPSQATCQACPIKKSCGLMRCPHCGYENAREPGWIAKIKEWIG